MHGFTNNTNMYTLPTLHILFPIGYKLLPTLQIKSFAKITGCIYHTSLACGKLGNSVLTFWSNTNYGINPLFGPLFPFWYSSHLMLTKYNLYIILASGFACL